MSLSANKVIKSNRNNRKYPLKVTGTARKSVLPLLFNQQKGRTMANSDAPKCPFAAGSNLVLGGSATTNNDWWPEQLNISILRQHDSKSNLMGRSKIR